jgi:selenocysteine lyase/cysteine desulfurase
MSRSFDISDLWDRLRCITGHHKWSVYPNGSGRVCFRRNCGERHRREFYAAPYGVGERWVKDAHR